MKRRRIDRYIGFMLCLLAGLYLVMAAQWLRRMPAPVMEIVTDLPPTAQDPFAKSHLRDRIPSVRMDDVPLATAIDQLKSQTHAAIEIRWALLKDVQVYPDTPASAVLFDVDLGTALHVLLKSVHSELDYGVVDDGTIVVTEGIENTPVSMVGYDVRGLISPPRPLPPPKPPGPTSFGSGGGIGAGGSFFDQYIIDGDFDNLCNVIHTCLRPDRQAFFPEPPPPSVANWAHRLIVIGTPQDHRKVESILRQLRASNAGRNAEHESKS